MENFGLVSNFLEIGQILFGEDAKIQYKVENDHEDPDPAELIFYLSREIENVVYTAQKSYTMFITSYGILLSSKEGDKYFEKYNFQSSITTLEDVLVEDQDCPSFKS